MKRFLFFVILIFGVTLSPLLSAPVRAEGGPDYTISTDITIADDFTTSVRTIIDIEANGGEIPQNLTLPVYGQNIKGIEATYADNNPLTVSNLGEQVQFLLAPALTGGQDTISVALSYSSTISVGFGRSVLFLLPPAQYGAQNVVSESVSLRASTEFDAPLAKGHQPTTSAILGGEVIYDWESDDGPIVKPLGLLFGDSAFTSVNLSKTLTNDSFWWKTESIVLPPDTNQQRVWINSISPEPNDISLDRDGNVIVSYRLRPRQSIDVVAQTNVAINNYVYSLNTQLGVNDINGVVVDRYTNLNEVWADTAITVPDADTMPAAEIIEEVYNQIVVAYPSSTEAVSFEEAKNRANALIGELRAHDIPARLVIGAAFGNGAEASTVPFSHAWAEVFVPEVGWITLDPTFELRGDYFGVTDMQRVALSLRGFDPEYPPENLTDFAISFVDQDIPVQTQAVPEVTATKHVIFPGLALKSVNVTMPEGTIVDNAGLLVGEGSLQRLGSLAPLQGVETRSLSFAANAFTSEIVQYGIFLSDAAEGGEIIAQATLNVQYWPMISIFVMALGLFLLRKYHGFQKITRLFSRFKVRGKDSRKDTLVVGSDHTGAGIEQVDMLSQEQSAEVARDPELVQKRPPVQPGATRSQAVPMKTEKMSVVEAAKRHPKTVQKEVKKRRPPLIQ